MFPTEAETSVLPTLPVHSLSPLHSKTQFEQYAGRRSDSNELPRSASYTDIVGYRGAGSSNGIKRTFSENVLALQPDPAAKGNSSVYVANKELLRRASRKAKNRIIGAKFSLPSETGDGPVSTNDSRQTGEEVALEHSKGAGRSVTGTIRSLARKSFLQTSSRSPSPNPAIVVKGSARVEKKRSRSPFKKSPIEVSEMIRVPAPVHSRNSSRSSQLEAMPDKSGIAAEAIGSPVHDAFLLEPPGRPISVISMKNKSETDLRLSRKSSGLSLRSSSHSRLSDIKVPPIPPSLSSDRLSVASFDATKKRDPLWGPFRALDGDYLNFQSKSSSQKAKVIRSSLLPFLKEHANHLSNRILRAEDLDRRVAILNKWWTGLLEMLNGRNNQSITGTDRPAFLEAVTGIMMRPEWRQPPFSSTSSAETPPVLALPISKSTNSLSSVDSGFLVESIHHNVRNTFVQNLLSQMVFVVERMSMRNAPASLVAFCGKACAYAFFFCPGIADILVRLWHIPIGTLRRVFAEFDVERGFKFDVASKNVASRFPPSLRSLSVTSQAGLARHLQHRTPPPLGAAYIRWYGPWVGRWSGRDSDLFFVFTKHFQLLISEYLPQNLDGPNTACIPGLVPVLAQVLTVLETTIYRQAGQSQAEKFASGTVEDIDNPDTHASLPLTIANASRSMAENRLIMVLRDILANPNPDQRNFRELYLWSFSNVLKAACRKISLYNNDACFVLCDLLEEVLPIMSRYQSSHLETAFIDWQFWLSVCRLMMQSHNTLTEVRLIAFVYSMWNYLISNDEMKRELCLGWILEPAFFQKHFNHWCPMVRHYFLRLLCWRVARSDGNASILDIQIYEAVFARLNTSWAHYSYLNAEAEMRNIASPSSAPCTPAPNRRLIIMRIDSQPARGSTMFSMDRFIAAAGTSNISTPYGNPSSLLNNLPAADSPTQQTKKRWNLFKNILPFTAPGNSRPGEVTPPKRTDGSRIMDDAASVESMSVNSDFAPPKSRPATPPHRPFSFRFSLEWLDRPQWPTKNRDLTAPMLPAAAQVLVQMRRQHIEAIQPSKPLQQDLATAKYSGRALAEWAQIVAEYENFQHRRREEGVPSGRLVETPTLGVESFRMFG